MTVGLEEISMLRRIALGREHFQIVHRLHWLAFGP